MLPCQPNKMAIGHKTYKLGRQSSNDHNRIMSLVMEKMQFNHICIVSLWELSVAMATELRGRSP